MSNINMRPTTPNKKTPVMQNIKNTCRGAKIKAMQTVAIAEAAAWLIVLLTCGAVIYNALKGNLVLNDVVFGAVCFATILVAMRMSWEFIQHLNSEGSKYEN